MEWGTGVGEIGGGVGEQMGVNREVGDEEQVVVHREDGRTVWMVNREVIRRGCGEWWRRGVGIDERKK